jgi:hypothetical protein
MVRPLGRFLPGGVVRSDAERVRRGTGIDMYRWGQKAQPRTSLCHTHKSVCIPYRPSEISLSVMVHLGVIVYNYKRRVIGDIDKST